MSGKNTQLVEISKFLARVLRHRPGSIGLTLDHEGWADIDRLIACAAVHGEPINRALLHRVVAENNKRRFALSPDRTRIRACQGHSVPVDLGLEPRTPPDLLYHGTAGRHLKSIKKKGVLPQRRHHVHLSPDAKTAASVGSRHGKPVVLVIDARAMAAAGYRFYRSENGIWLTDKVPPDFFK